VLGYGVFGIVRESSSYFPTHSVPPVLSFGERRVRGFKCASIRVNIWVESNWKQTSCVHGGVRTESAPVTHFQCSLLLDPLILLRAALALPLLTCCLEIHCFLPSLLLSRILSPSSIPLLSKNYHFIPSTASSLPSQLQALRTFIESFISSQSSFAVLG
jgi:hypothetical protein